MLFGGRNAHPFATANGTDSWETVLTLGKTLTHSLPRTVLTLGKKQAISVTEAARNFADCVNRVHYQNVTYVLLRNGVPVARLIPDNEKLCSGRDLAQALKNVELSSEEARTWRRELRSARKKLKAPGDKWR